MSDHIAIMNKKWDLIPKILSGKKTIESRWYKSRAAPWDRVQVGDTIYFKNSGEPITVAARVSQVLQFKNLTDETVSQIVAEHGRGLALAQVDVKEWVHGKNYCILMYLEDPREVVPAFDIDKTGYGSATAWLTVWDINRVKKYLR
jgi:ASC-1-like (ASCH) protein